MTIVIDRIENISFSSPKERKYFTLSNTISNHVTRKFNQSSKNQIKSSLYSLNTLSGVTSERYPAPRL